MNLYFDWQCARCWRTNTGINKACYSCAFPNELNTHSIALHYFEFCFNIEDRKLALENGQTLEKHSEFFNNTKSLVVDMDDFTLECHIRELGLIAFEARARVLAASEEKRQRSAKKTREEKEWILGPTGNNINVTDSINVVKERKQRQTKAEKNLALLMSLGVTGKDAEALVAEAVRKQTGSQVTTVSKPDPKVIQAANHAANVDSRPVSKPFVNPFAKK